MSSLPGNLRYTLRRSPSLVTLLEAMAMFAAFVLYKSALPHVAGNQPSSPLWHLVLATWLLAFTAGLYIWGRGRGILPAFSLASIHDVPTRALRALRLGLILCLCGLAAAILGTLVGWSNPLWQTFLPSTSPMAALLPAMLLSSLAVGASEELLFRLCLPSLFRNAGLPGQGAGLVSMLLFTLGHTGQGRIGVLASIFFGAVLQRSADRGEGYPTLALGHAFYDFSILCLMFAV